MKKNSDRHPPMSVADTFKMMKTIEANGSTDEDGYWSYNDGWSDRDIAAMFNCHEKTVTVKRAKTFGRLKHAGNTIRSVKELTERMDQLEQRLMILEMKNIKLERGEMKVAGE